VKRSSGEDHLVARLRRLLPASSSAVHAGIGDDCAAVAGGKRGILSLLKTDCVVEGRHFSARDAASAVGWKAACRAASDIAACGGAPRFALVTCVLRRGQTDRWLEGLYRGLSRAGRAYGFEIVGGELARTEGPAVISVAMTGEVSRSKFVPRGGGRPGDVLYVTGVLGGSMRSGWHLRFTPRVPEAGWLVENFRPRAMMDVSDGLAADLPRLAAASGTGFVLDPSCLPRRRGASLRQALGDGEDFELLFAVAPRRAARLEAAWGKKFPRLPLSRIGRLAPRGTAEGLGLASGFDHFAS
jgi:thiamine-monophosphate kinase